MNCNIAIDRRILIVVLVALSATSCAQPVLESSDTIQFADPIDFIGVNFKPGEPANDASLLNALSSTQDKNALESDLAVLKRMPSHIHLRVVGFTDTKECLEESCLELSMRRAVAVHGWLLNHGVPRKRLSAPFGFGSARPVGDNGTEEGRARNRRAYISYEDFHEKRGRSNYPFESDNYSVPFCYGWTPYGGYSRESIDRQAEASIDGACQGSTEWSCK